ncbi:MAG TPA: DUF4349 domain-containing protein [Acidimicrobiia bacterium]|nr:DUF4349 domain-containing protein [Acidimicrobiia bacterium]
MRRVALILAMGVAIAACSGDDRAAETTSVGGAADRSEFASGEEGATTTAGAEAVPAGDGAIAVDLEVAQDRKVIRQAQLQLEADDTRAAIDRIISLAEASGGFVADATVHPVEGDDDQPAANLTLRIPAAELTQVMTSIKGSVENVVSESQGAQDVTGEYIDLEARLTNLAALEVELRALLTEVRQQPDSDPDELLRVYNEVSNVRGQIEQIQGQLNHLDDVVDLATLTIGLTPTPAVVPIVEDTWEPVDVARDALRNLVVGLQGVADWGIRFALFTLPMLLLVLGVPTLIGLIGYRLWKKRRPATTQDPVPSES